MAEGEHTRVTVCPLSFAPSLCRAILNAGCGRVGEIMLQGRHAQLETTLSLNLHDLIILILYDSESSNVHPSMHKLGLFDVTVRNLDRSLPVLKYGVILNTKYFLHMSSSTASGVQSRLGTLRFLANS